MLGHLAPARRRLVLGLAASVVVAAIVIAFSVWRSTGGADGSGEAVDQGDPGPVLLIPGYGGSEGQLEQLADALRASGRDADVVSLPDRAQGELAEQAEVLGTAVREARERTGAASVDLVGYSAGGVVARLWVTEDGGSAQVRRLVTLSSPHQGTQLALLGGLFAGACPEACQQLATDSPLLSRLDAERLPPGPAYLSLWTTQDDVVFPATSSVLTGVQSPSLQSICPSTEVRHGGVPSYPLTVALVRESLGTGPIPEFGPGDCTRLSS